MIDESKLNDLFRKRLGRAAMDVRDGFWEEIRRDLPPAVPARKPLWTPFAGRLAAAAAVALLLGAASMLFWHFSPREKPEVSFARLPVQEPGEKIRDSGMEEETFPLPADGRVPIKAQASPHAQVADAQGNSASIHFSITVRQRMYAPQFAGGQRKAFMPGSDGFRAVPANDEAKAGTGDPFPGENAAEPCDEGTGGGRKKWAWRWGIGTALPKGICKMPLTWQAMAEYQFNKTLALESGLQYRYQPVKGRGDLHTLAVPVKLNVMLAKRDRLALYATAGGAVEMNSHFSDAPFRLSALAGVGVRYKLGGQFALFAEPVVWHRFATNSEDNPGLREERPTNLNLICGMCITY